MKEDASSVTTPSPESGDKGPKILTRRLIIIIVMGILIVGMLGAITTIQTECSLCAGDGKIECPICNDTGALAIPFTVECGCKGEDPDCPVCLGGGYYNTLTTTPCPRCLGKGAEICPDCVGSGSIKLIDRIFKR